MEKHPTQGILPFTYLMKPSQNKPKSIFSVLKPYRTMIMVLIGVSIIANGTSLAIPKIIALAIDAFTAGTFSFSRVAIELVAVALVIGIFTILQSLVQVYTSERVARDLRKKISDTIAVQDYLFIERNNPAKILTNLTSDVDSVKQFVSIAIVSMVYSIVILIGASILLISINWKLGLAVIAVLPIIGVIFGYVFSKVRVLFVRSRGVIDWLNKVINESILGASLIRVLNLAQPEYKKFLAANTEARSIGLSILSLFAGLIPVIMFVSNLAILIILMLGGHFVIAGTMSLGNLAAFNSYVALFIFPIITMGFMSNIIAQASASYGRILQIIEAPEVSSPGTLTESLIGDIEFDRVTVSYEGKQALREVTFQIKPKTKTAIIGPTGAGKTQLLYALTGLIKPDSGTINYDHKSVELFDPKSLYPQIGFVFQDSIMFNMTIRENIAFSKTATNESLTLAVQTAELSDFTESLPEKLDTIVSERGTSLSGGQKQRIMLARALALNPKILLLDDFTARVDAATEQKILNNIAKNYPEITLVSVTQKIASIEHYDKIMVLMEGELLAEGTHTELLKTSPEYVQIFNSQRSTTEIDGNE